MLLVVDDCPEDREVYRRYLSKDPQQSYEILEAESAEEGLVLCQKSYCEAILLDFYLPDMNGLEFLEQLRDDQWETPVPVIMLTGQGNEQVAVQAIKRGAQDYLVKQQLKPDMLQLAVKNAIKNSRLQTELVTTQERQHLIHTIALRIRQSLNLEETLNTAVREVRQLLECDRVLLYQSASKIEDKIVAESVETGYISAMGMEIQDNWGLELGQELTHYQLPNIYKAPLSNSYLNFLEKLQVKAILVVPILLSNEEDLPSKLWGFLIAHQCSTPRHWEAGEAKLLEELSVQLAIAIQQAELLTQTRAALQKEKELNQFKSQIIATVSHEYRSPLASILAAASTLKQNWQQLDKFRRDKFLHLIEDKARHMSELVSQMLLINKLELSKTKFNPQLIEPVRFFSKLMEEQIMTNNDRHKFIFMVTGKIETFWADTALLRQIFINLISNAIKYSPDGEYIELHLMVSNSRLMFHIKDEGIGIPAEEQKNLFQSFSRGSNVGTIPGTGLGLAIVKACVNLHAGDISLESEIGRGTKITVSLPFNSKNQ